MLAWSGVGVVRDSDGMDLRRNGVEVRMKKAESKGWGQRWLGAGDLHVAVEPRVHTCCDGTRSLSSRFVSIGI